MPTVMRTAMALLAGALVPLTAATASAGECANCQPASRTIVKTHYNVRTVQQVRNVVRYRDVIQVRHVYQTRDTVRLRVVRTAPVATYYAMPRHADVHHHHRPRGAFVLGRSPCNACNSCCN